jgi:hypothetical protein
MNWLCAACGYELPDHALGCEATPLDLSTLPAGPTGDPVETTKQKRNCDTASALESQTLSGPALQGILPDLPVWLL